MRKLVLRAQPLLNCSQLKITLSLMGHTGTTTNFLNGNRYQGDSTYSYRDQVNFLGMDNMETRDPLDITPRQSSIPTQEFVPRNHILIARNHGDFYNIMQPYIKPTYHQNPRVLAEEPIDLTPNHRTISTTLIKNENRQSPQVNDENFLAARARSRPKIYMPNQTPMRGFFNDVLDLQTSENKQAEILKAAKSLFSKRTRTLYHWMYPNTSKQQIKMAVANSWDNLSTQEKQFYISQVLVKFGFPQCHLMVNPQLGGIRAELPTIPDPSPSHYSAKELQTALSSISENLKETVAQEVVDVGDGDLVNMGAGSAFMIMGPQGMSDGKRRQGRPPGSKNKKRRTELGLGSGITREFQDDPELSNELEKFAFSFNCFK